MADKDFDETIDQKNQSRALDKRKQAEHWEKENKKIAEPKKHRSVSINIGIYIT
ncbi:MAG: hypothetical protein M3352_10320 [Bacteroidota bacterium]|nr:hypothetical protein [Bacteroidota bacterium]